MCVRLFGPGSGAFCGVQPLLRTQRSRWARPPPMLSLMPWMPMYATGAVPPAQPLISPGLAMSAIARNTVGREHASEMLIEPP